MKCTLRYNINILTNILMKGRHDMKAKILVLNEVCKCKLMLSLR